MSANGATPSILAKRGIFTTHIAISASAALAVANEVLGQICGKPVDLYAFATNPENLLLWFTAGVDWITRHAGIGKSTS